MLSAIFLANLLGICQSSLFKDSRSLDVEIVRIHGSDRLGLGMKILQFTEAEWDQDHTRRGEKTESTKTPYLVGKADPT